MLLDIRQAFASELPALSAWTAARGASFPNVTAFIARDAGGAIVGVLTAAVVDATAVVVQLVGANDVQAALITELSATYPLKRLVALTSNDWLCTELRRAGARHVVPDPCLVVGEFHNGN